MNKRIKQAEKEVVLARVKAYDDDYEVSVGSKGTFNKDELLENIEKETEIGKEIVQIQMEYLRDLVNGNIYKLINQ